MYVPTGKQFYQVSVNRIKKQWPYLTAASGMITSNISVYYFTIYSYIRFSKKSNQGDKMTNSFVFTVSNVWLILVDGPSKGKNGI